MKYDRPLGSVRSTAKAWTLPISTGSTPSCSRVITSSASVARLSKASDVPAPVAVSNCTSWNCPTPPLGAVVLMPYVSPPLKPSRLARAWMLTCRELNSAENDRSADCGSAIFVGAPRVLSPVTGSTPSWPPMPPPSRSPARPRALLMIVPDMSPKMKLFSLSKSIAMTSAMMSPVSVISAKGTAVKSANGSVGTGNAYRNVSPPNSVVSRMRGSRYSSSSLGVGD